MDLWVSHIESQFFTRMVTGDGRVAFTLTGIVVGNERLQGQADWMRRRVAFTVPVPLQPNHVLHLDHWAPFVTLSSISNDHTSTNAGWAVDGFALSSPDSPVRGKVGVLVDIAVRDIDGFIDRLGYNIHLIGREDAG